MRHMFFSIPLSCLVFLSFSLAQPEDAPPPIPGRGGGGPPPHFEGPPPGGPPPHFEGPPPGGPFGPFFNKPVDPDRNINDECDVAEHCKAAYSTCKAGVCVCREGFEAGSDLKSCKSTKSSCPYGGGNGASCSVKRMCDGKPCSEVPQPSPFPFGRKKRQISGPRGGGPPQVPGGPAGFAPPPMITFEDTCPEDHYCSIHDLGNQPEDSFSGHCCKRPDASCPVGEPLEGQTCGPGTRGFCPPDHYCAMMQDGRSPLPLTARCCPKACADTAVLANGTCYSIQLAGEECQIDEQCLRSNAKCVEGKCACPKGTLTQNGICVRVFCQGGSLLLPPETKDDGDLKRCDSGDACSENGYCAKDHQICCPKPQPYCPPVNFVPGLRTAMPGEPCKITEGEGACDEGHFCFQYYYSTEPATGAVCCRRPNIPADVAVNPRGPPPHIPVEPFGGQGPPVEPPVPVLTEEPSEDSQEPLQVEPVGPFHTEVIND